MFRAERFWSPARRRRWLMFAVLAVAVPSAVATSEWGKRHALLVNRTTSLPNWAFLIDRAGRPERGDPIFFEPPPSDLLVRHFGRDPEPFGKLVYGIPGDRVDRRGRLFLVNGNPVGVAKTVSLRGEPLTVGPTGIVPRGCYFVATPNRHSFDSRYAAIGWVCRAQVIGVGRAIL